MGTVAVWFLFLGIATIFAGVAMGGMVYDADEGVMRPAVWLENVGRIEFVLFLLTMLVMQIREWRRKG